MRSINSKIDKNATLKLYIIFFVFLFIQPLKVASKSIENQLSNYVIKQQSKQLYLLEKLVNINSGTTNSAGVYQVGELLRPEFEKLGFDVYWVEEPKTMQRAGTLVAKHAGNNGKRLLLIGHLDTVFSSNSSFQSFKKTGNFATGPGVIDDKGGDVVILYALKALHATNLLTNMTITVILTGDEEDSGKPTSISRKPLLDAATNSDIALDFEWAVTPDTATIGRRGISHWTIIAKGHDAHSSEIFQKKSGFGAIYELVRILNNMRDQLSLEKYLSFSPGLIVGGTSVNDDKSHSRGIAHGKDNIIAKLAMAKGDLRFLTTKQKISAKNKISAIVNSHLPCTTAAVTFQDAIPAMSPTAANLKLLKKYSQVSNTLGYGKITSLDLSNRGASDISHIASLVSASLAGLGPLGWGAHSEKETLDVHSLSIQTQRAALLIYRLTHSMQDV